MATTSVLKWHWVSYLDEKIQLTKDDLSLYLSAEDILFLFYGLQNRQLYFKQIEIKIKSYFLGFFIADRLKKGKTGTFHSNMGLLSIKIKNLISNNIE